MQEKRTNDGATSARELLGVVITTSSRAQSHEEHGSRRRKPETANNGERVSTSTSVTVRERHQRYNRSSKGRARSARYSSKAAITPGTYRYNEYHGIGEAGEAKRLRDKRLRERRIAEGLCTSCGKSRLGSRGDTKCYHCLNRQSLRGIERTIAKHERLLALPKDDPEYLAIVRREIGIPKC
jgi:hypothetical protein